MHSGSGQWAIIYNIGALHTGTENGFTGSGSPIRIQCDHAWAPLGTQTMRIALLDWISHMSRSTARSSDPDRACVEAKWSLNPDPHRIRIQGPVWRAPLINPITLHYTGHRGYDIPNYSDQLRRSHPIYSTAVATANWNTFWGYLDATVIQPSTLTSLLACRHFGANPPEVTWDKSPFWW